MVKLLEVNQLVEIADCVGVRLHPANISDANLYVLVDPAGTDLYVGLAQSARGRRHRDEDRWGRGDHTLEVLSGIVALMRENVASRRPFFFDPMEFDGAKVIFAINGSDAGQGSWEGGSFDALRQRIESGIPPTAEEIEEFLVRIHIRAGCLIGNSQYASQWENPIGRFADTLAVLAVDSARVNGIVLVGQ